MLRSMTVLVSVVALLGFPGQADASRFGAVANQQNLAMSNSDESGASVFFGRGGDACDSDHPSRHCGKSLPGYTLPDCAGAHKGPNGVFIECK